MNKARMTAFPAAAAAGPTAANTPAPIIDPSPTITASLVPSLRASREAGGGLPAVWPAVGLSIDPMAVTNLRPSLFHRTAWRSG